MLGWREPAFDWAALAPRLLHPMKVAIIEALLWIGKPLSAPQLAELFDDPPKRSSISYHLKELAALRVVRIVWSRPVRGAREKFFGLRSEPRRLQIVGGARAA